MSKSRAYCLTLNNWTMVELELFMVHTQSPTVLYWICGKEVGEEGTPHLQAYLYYKNAVHRNMNKWAELLGCDRWHIEVARGTPTDNENYCSKDGEFVKGGVLPVSNNDRYAAVRDMCKAGKTFTEVLEEYPQIGMQYARSVQTMVNVYQSPRNFKTELYWLYGATGTGKSRFVFELDPAVYTKPPGKWWSESYVGQENVIMDDFRPSKELPFAMLLQLSDRYACPVEFKGGLTQFRSKRIFITTCKNMEETWAACEWLGDESIAQLRRRITYECQFPLNAIDKLWLSNKLCPTTIQVSMENATDTSNTPVGSEEPPFVIDVNELD